MPDTQAAAVPREERAAEPRRAAGPAGDPRAPRLTPASGLLRVVGVGLAWYAGELALAAGTGRALDLTVLLTDFVRFLPWQVALFALCGLPVALLAWRFPLGPAAAGWLGIGIAGFVLLGARVGEGLLRTGSPAWAVAGVTATAAGMAATLGLLAAIGRGLPGRLRRAWPLAAWVAASLFFLSSMQRVGPAIGLMEGGSLSWLALLDARDALAALAAGAAVLLLSARLRRGGPLLLLAAAVLASSVAAIASTGGGTPRPDVIVILVDTWRWDHLGANAGRPDLTPALDAVAAESIRFTRAWSPGNYTKLALPGIHASLPPRATGMALPEDAVALAELLRDAGYATVGISTNPLVSGAFGYRQGFDRLLDPNSTTTFLVTHMLQVLGMAAPALSYRAGIVTSALYYRPISEVRRAALRLLEDAGRPLFLYLHTMDPHGPYCPPHRHLPPGYRHADFVSYYDFDHLSGKGVLNSEAFRPKLENLRARYEAEVRFTDAELGRLVAELRARGRWDEALVWVLSDHGEAFGERDFAGHGAKKLTDAVLRVPLLLKLPRSWGVTPRVEETPVSTYDLLPTTLGLLGLEPPSWIFGQDLGPLVRRDAAGDGERVLVSYGYRRIRRDLYSEDFYVGVRWPWKLEALVIEEETTPLALYQLEQDPEESSDVLAEHPEVADALLRALADWRTRESAVRATLEHGDRTVDPLTREQLRRLGYTD
jgi:arylsulfatase